MRALAFGLVMMTLPATLLACAVDASSPVSEEDRGKVHDGAETSGASTGTGSPPIETTTAGEGRVPNLQSHKQASVDPAAPKTNLEPPPLPWRGDGSGGTSSSGKGTQKKDGNPHTKMRDPIEPDDGTHP